MKLVKKLYSRFLNHFPYIYARRIYNKKTGKRLVYSNPDDINQKLFWLNRYWQDKKIVECSDKVKVRDYVRSLGYESLLTTHYGVYSGIDEIDFSILPDQFVLKMNNSGAGWFISICNDKGTYNIDEAKFLMACGLKTVPGVDVADFQYQYIEPQIIAEEYLPNSEENPRYEIQFFCFNGKAKHILLRNDLGESSDSSFAISYDMNWNRVHERKKEDMSINIPRPDNLDEMIEIANNLASQFPHVRVDLYYYPGGGKIIFGELTFTTSGKILHNYKDEVLMEWGRELILPPKLHEKWNKTFHSWKDFRENVIIPKHTGSVVKWNVNTRLGMQ